MAFVELTAVRAELYDVSVPLRVPFRISGGIMTHRRSLVVVLETNGGFRGFGEAAPFEEPFYSSETIDSARAILQDLFVPRVLGVPFDHPAHVLARLTQDVRGNHMARAAVETAWWDLQSRTQNVSLASLVRDRLRELGVGHRIPSDHILVCGASLGIPEGGAVDPLLSQVQAAVDGGFRRIKLKVKPGWSVLPLRAVVDFLRAHENPMDVTVDANASFHIHRDRAELDALDKEGAAFLEQPFGAEDIWDAVAWERRARTPICVDESLVSDDVARQLIDMDGPRIWNLKVQRLGGLEETCRVWARGTRAGVSMWIGTMPETGLGAQAALAFGGLQSGGFASDVGPSDWWFLPGKDLLHIDMNEKGEVEVPRAPGNLPKLDGSVAFRRWV